MHMSQRDLPKRLDRYNARIDFQRVALTEADCLRLGNGPSFSVKTKRNDKNYGWFRENYGDRCWELDAMDPADLRFAVDFAICGLIDWNIWHRDDRAEKAETESIERVISDWPGPR
jgi:hypothetical protein